MDEERWEEVTDNEYLRFERIPEEQRLSTHPDICAMMYLDKRGLVKTTGGIIGAAGHDIVVLDVDVERLTDDDAVYLSRCGVHWDEYDSLAFFA